MARRKSVLVPVREPNGRLLRDVERMVDARPPAEVRRLRDAASAGMAAPEWGTELGRLFLAGKIGPRIFETGKRCARLFAAYRKAIASPLEAPTSSAFVNEGRRRDADPDTLEGQRDAIRDGKIMDAAEEAFAVLDCVGADKRRVVEAVCERNETPIGEVGLDNLRLGLAWLGQHWGLLNLTGSKSYVR